MQEEVVKGDKRMLQKNTLYESVFLERLQNVFVPDLNSAGMNGFIRYGNKKNTKELSQQG